MKYILIYMVTCVCCTMLIIVGNDLLIHSPYQGTICDTILQVNYAQWLPVSAVALWFAFTIYLLLTYVIPIKLPLPVSGLICGIISMIVILLSGISTPFLSPGWYEIKNMTAFFISGFTFSVWTNLLA